MSEKYKDKDWLYEQYVEKGLTQKEIGNLCGVARTTIGNWVRRLNINKFIPPYHTLRSSNGYEIVQSNAGGERNTIKIHRLIAVSEHGFDKVAENDIHHSNDMKIDNRHNNIELKDHKEHGRMSANKRWNNE